MTGKLLQVIGLSTVLGMFTAIVAGTILLHDRVRIVVQDGAAGERPDQAALLLDDLQQLRAELEEQRQAISQGLSQLAEASERNAARRQTELQGSLGTLAELRAQLRDLAQQNAQLADRIARLAAAGSVRAAEPAVSTPEPAAAANPAELPAAAAPGTPTVEAPAAGPPAAAPGQNFLSFHLPDRRFRFDREQEFKLLPELCRVGFDARSTLHDFSGVTSKVSGSFTANLADPAGKWHGEVRCAASSLVTGVDGRDASMRERLDTAHHPEIVFQLTGFVPDQDGIDKTRRQVHGAVVGQMAIHGVTRELRMQVTLRVDDSQRLVLDGQVPLELSDYEITVPSQLGVISVNDEVKLWIALRARVQAGGHDAK